MKVSLVALFAAAAAAAPNLAGRNVPDSCDKQLQQCNGLANADENAEIYVYNRTNSSLSQLLMHRHRVKACRMDCHGRSATHAA